MKDFRALTAQGQARRLRQLAWNALQFYDLRVTRLRLITNSFNGIFRVDTEGKDKYILRVVLPEGGHNRSGLLAELAWLSAISNQTKLSVPTPFASRDGALFVEASAPGVPEPRLCVIFSWVPGVDLAERINSTTAYLWGSLMAELHTHAAGFHLPSGAQAPRYDSVFYFPDPIVLENPAYADFFPPEILAVFKAGIARVDDAMDRLQASNEPPRLLHGDLHQWNIRISRNVLSPIDFEDLVWGWPVQDIGITLYYLLDHDDYQSLRNAFQAGYTSRLPWPEHFAGDVNAFIAARGINLANFVVQDPNPDWRKQAETIVGRIYRRIIRLLAPYT